MPRVPMEVTVVAADGTALAADLYRPAAPRQGALLAPALGVSRRFYRGFAEFLAAAGVAVLVPDYRGMGGATLSDWAELDLPAALAHLRGVAPDVPLAWIGHSMG